VHGHTLAGGLTEPVAWKGGSRVVYWRAPAFRSPTRLPARRRTAAVTLDYAQPTTSPTKIIPRGSDRTAPTTAIRPPSTCPSSRHRGTALVRLEIYRRDRTWRLRAVEQGYADNLAGLAASSASTSPNAAARHPNQSRPAAAANGRSRCGLATARPRWPHTPRQPIPGPVKHPATPSGRQTRQRSPAAANRAAAPRVRRTGHEPWS